MHPIPGACVPNSTLNPISCISKATQQNFLLKFTLRPTTTNSPPPIAYSPGIAVFLLYPPAITQPLTLHHQQQAASNVTPTRYWLVRGWRFYTHTLWNCSSFVPLTSSASGCCLPPCLFSWLVKLHKGFVSRKFRRRD